MTLHKISAGDGYTYLTRQVAAGDNTDRSRDTLAAYYGNRGESPGTWSGRLAADIGIVGAVSEAQMLALFGEGRHPDAARIEEALVATGASTGPAAAKTRLGRPFYVFDNTSQFPTVLAKAYANHNLQAGERSRAPIDAEVRAEIRTGIARAMFANEYQRPPADARELSGWIARNTRPDKVAIAGYDLTFSPAKSVSVLWALAPRAVAEQIAAAHDAAVAAVMGRIEAETAYTRQGGNGVRQVKVDGIIAAAFVHRSSRAGDPDLHTHVTVSAKVRAPDNAWLTLDGRMLYKGNVTYSEMYNSALETELLQRLPGLKFADVPRAGAGAADKRAVRELDGIDPSMLALMSKRSAAIEPRRAELAAQFVRDHGRTPTRSEQLALAQQATLDTREAKKEQRTHAEERTAWRLEAESAVGSRGLTTMLDRTLTAAYHQPPAATFARELAVGRAARATLQVVTQHRAVWQDWHVRAEAQRQVRRMADALDPAVDTTFAGVQQLVDDVVESVLDDDDVLPLTVPDLAPATPAVLQNPDGSSQYDVFRAATFTTRATLAAEARIVACAGRRDGRRADVGAVDTAVLESHANGKTLNTGQVTLVRGLATSGARFQLALAPAGSGKTTAMKALARGWQLSGGQVVGLAPSAAAASELAASIGQNADTVDKLVFELDRLAADPAHRVPEWIAGIGDSTLIVVDEVSLASTAHLDRVLAFAIGHGASVRGVGDPAQRASVAAGGVMRDVETTHGAVSLAEVMRFDDPTEGAASLALRAGDPSAIGHYLDRGRVHVGDLDTSLRAVYDGWAADRDRGVDTVMLAPLREQVAALNIRARAERLSSENDSETSGGRAATLAWGQQASAGDLVQTRRNDRTLTLGLTDFVRNGYRFQVDRVGDDGSVLARHLESGRRVVLPVEYLADHAELGYARTVAAAQGMTAGGVLVDTAGSVRVDGTTHVLVDPGVMDRESLYVAMTRGTTANHAYVVAAGRGDEHAGSRPDTVAPATAAELLARVLERSSTQTSATTEVGHARDPFRQLAPAVNRYSDAIRVAAVDLLGVNVIEELAGHAEQLVPGVTTAPAWPTLRGHLALLELDGRHDGRIGGALTAMAAAVIARDMSGVTDTAAVIDWRLVFDGCRSGPLPWLPAVPVPVASDPTWGQYVAHLAERVDDYATGVAAAAGRWSESGVVGEVPTWARRLVAAGAHERSLARIAVWRAAHDVDDLDTRPTGPPVLGDAERGVQRDLDLIAAGYGINANADAVAMTPLAERLEPRLLDDPYWPQLATRLRAIERAGIEVSPLTATALRDDGPLPDEQASAALWWRLSRYLAPNLDADALVGGSLRPPWSSGLDELVGPELAEAVLTSAAWPALVARIDAAAREGFVPSDLLADGLKSAQGAGVPSGEMTTAALWHVSLIADPAPVPLDQLPPDPVDLIVAPPHDLHLAQAAEVPHGGRHESQVGEAEPFIEESWSSDELTSELWLQTSFAVLDELPDPATPYSDLPTSERVVALTSDLHTARADLAALTAAVMTDRGPHVLAVMDQVRALRQRADELAPLTADRDFALADWRGADSALARAEQDLRAARAHHAAPVNDTGLPAPTIEVAMHKHEVDYSRSEAQAALDALVAAEVALDEAADGDLVTHTDATEVWTVAAGLDLDAVNDQRAAVRAIQDSLWRANVAASRVVVVPSSSPVQFDAWPADAGLDYGAIVPIEPGGHDTHESLSFTSDPSL